MRRTAAQLAEFMCAIAAQIAESPTESLRRPGRPGRDRMAQERDRLSAHIEELLRTRDSLDGLMAAARADRDGRRRTAA